MRALLSLVFLSPGVLLSQTVPLQETWATGYSGKDSTGPYVLGHWKFDGDTAVKDVSGKDNDLSLQGARLTSGGKFGSGLQSSPGFPVTDTSHAARTDAKPSGLSPKGAFTLEMWIKPDADFKPELRCYLMDKKYVDHTDYQWQLLDADKAGKRRMSATLGFGSHSEMMFSEPFGLATDEWHHVAFVYDGAGTGSFFLDGQSLGGASRPGHQGIVPGVKALSIADRLGSNYGGFPGVVDEVRICEGALNFQKVSIRMETPRTVYRRMEAARPVQIIVTNLQRVPLSGGNVSIACAGAVNNIPLPELASGKTYTASYTLNTALKPAEYPLAATLKLTGYETTMNATLEIVARPIPGTMPVVMWGAGFDDMDQLKEIGFTHFVGIGAAGGAGDMWTNKKVMPPGKPELIQTVRQSLDNALRKGLNVVASLSPHDVPMKEDGYKRVDRDGKPYIREDIIASRPELPPFFENVGRSIAQTYGDHPAFAAALIDSEVRDSSTPSFSPVELESYKKFAGTDIPPEVKARWGVDYKKLPGFPADRVLPDDHPILKYYRWFWTVGDGWNGLHSALNKGVKAGNSDVWTWFDPAVRQPSISGAGGSVDILSHWTYTYPNPLAIGLCTDQLFAMSAASGRGQKVMKMTQLIWYRSQTAPKEKHKVDDVVAWDDHDPDAAYITIAPHHLREAFWTKIARPIQGIMYHGWQSLVNDPSSTSSYRFTNPNTVHVLRDLTHNIVQPLGPTLIQVGDERSEVVLLESFTSQMFAQRGGYGGNNNWAADLWLALQYAHVQLDVMFEETLVKSGLSGRKYLVMPHCDVLTRSVVDKILAWQKKGGKIIADEFLCPALKADILIPSVVRTKDAAKDKAMLLTLGKTLAEHQELPRKATCDNPEIVLRQRRAGDAIYLFAVNDQREAGTYVGQNGLVLENGLPSSGTITLPMDVANVYDLVSGRYIVTQRSGGETPSTSWKMDLGPCDGRVFLITPKPLLGLSVDVPESAAAGNSVTISTTITTTDNAALNAVIPLKIEIMDANGRPFEFSGYHAAAKGKLDLKLDIAANEDPGVWQVRVSELASQMEVTKWFRVGKPLSPP